MANNGIITEEQKNLIENVLPIDIIKENHYELVVDRIKWSSSFNEEYLKTHLFDFFKLYIELFIQNPIDYIKAYLLQTSGFWSFTVNGLDAYVCTSNWVYYGRNFDNRDLINEVTGFSLNEYLSPKYYFSGGLFFWITAISFVITSQIADKKFLLGYLPLLILWGTIMIATPIAVSLRYIFILVLAIPLNFIYPLIAKKHSILKN